MQASCQQQRAHLHTQQRCTFHTRARRAPRLAATSKQPVQLYDFHDQLVPYEQAWAWQKQQVELLAAAAGQPGAPPGRVLLLQHPPVYTLGAGATPEHLRFDAAAPPHPLYRVERGGEVTYHGPGQLVLYPILDLSNHSRDLHWYLRALEEVVVGALAAASGLEGERLPGLTGVWVGGAKVAAIGVRAKKWVTYHGLALNVVTDLAPFTHITPCGIQDRPVTSVHQLLAAAGHAAPPHIPVPPTTTAAAATEVGGLKIGGEDGSISSSSSRSSGSSSSGSSSELVQQHTHLPGDHQQQQRQQAVGPDQAALLLEYRYALLESFEAVFGVHLVPPPPQQAAVAQEGLQAALLEAQPAGTP